MGVEERQMYEKNKKAKNTGVAILIFGFLLCMLGFASGNAVSVISIGRVVLFAILAITYSLLYGKYKHSTKFRDIGAVSLAISYCLIVFYTKSTYMYAYSYLLLIYAMIYMDKKFTSRYIPAIAILNIICMIRFMVAVEGSTDVALIQGVFATFACVQAYNIVSISERHSKETMQAITDNAEKEREVHQKMVDISNNLSDKFEVAKQTFEEMNESMEASDRAVGEISESTKVTAESVEKQTRLTTDIQSNLENANQDTQKMKEAADASAVAVRAGKTAMEQLASQARLTGELNRKSQETTNELSNRIKDVEDITGEILNISSQTNLLALNASIEAARAGEAGRGFAVVADEIRQLSDQTKNSVNKITEIINRLVENSNEASENMTKSIAATEEQNQMVENAIGDINQIDEKNQMLVELIEQISGQVGYILNANTQITDSISNLSAMSEEVAASSENGKAVMDDSMNAVKQLDDLFTEIYQIAQNMARVAE